MIRRAERRHRQHVAQLMRSRTLQTVGSFAEQTSRGGGSTLCNAHGHDPERVGHESTSLIQTVYSISCQTTKIAPGRSSTTRGLPKPPTRVWMSDRSYQKMRV